MSTPRWLVQLIGERSDLDDLASWFPDGPTYVLFEQDQHYLAGADFAPLQSATEVRECAEAALDIITAAARLLVGVFAHPKLGAVYREEADGTRHATVFGAVLDAVVRTKLGVVGQSAKRPTRAQALVAMANLHPSLSTAMLLWSDDARTWPRLYRIMEELENALGTSVNKAGLCAANERERFRRSANSPTVAGRDARHANGAALPPSKPMSLNDAVALIRSLFVGTLERVSHAESRGEG
jgi:hypothetical protein